MSSVAQPRAESKAGRVGRLGLRGGRYRKHTATERFWALVVKGESCWLFQGRSSGHGGHKHLALDNGQRTMAHKFSWMLHYGPIPAGQKVCHRCDVPACVNPAHLFIGSQAENVHDSARKGRKNAWGIQKLNADDVYQIRARVAAGQLQKDVAKAFGIARNTVSGIVHRKSWAHLPPVTEAGVYGPSSEPVHVTRCDEQRRAG